MSLPFVDVLPDTVLFLSVAVKLQMPLPFFAVLPDTVLFVSVTVPEPKMPPPHSRAMLFDTVLLTIVSVP
jgi:hypothetical protein